MKYNKEKIVEIPAKTKTPQMSWAVLSKAVNGRSEVIKVTNHEEADQAVRENPEAFYKSGPFMLV
jgi:hypothetical protein